MTDQEKPAEKPVPSAPVAAAPVAPAVTAEQRQKDATMEEGREHNVSVNNPAAPEAVARQHKEVDDALAKRNEQNQEGHDRNMQKIEQDAEEAQARTAHADDPRSRHVPTGKENNRNTPRVLPDGTKVWDT